MTQKDKTNLLIEFYSEEIPASIQTKSYPQIKELVVRELKTRGIGFENIKLLSSPLRMTFLVENMQKILPEKTEIIRGPKTSAPDDIIDRFCASRGIEKSDLQKSTPPGAKSEIYIYEKFTPASQAADQFEGIINAALKGYKWPKSMLWGESTLRWPRPLKSILCITDDGPSPIKFHHLVASNITCGHKFLSPGRLQINSVEEYEKLLEQNYVIVSRDKRKETIKKDIVQICKNHNLKLKEDEHLLDEVAGLCEWPRALIGKIDDKFRDLPEQIIIMVMRGHQKYFACFDKSGKLAPYFIFVSNMEIENMDNIISGNEKVMSARLEDAMFFYNNDLATSMEDRKKKLKTIIFQEGLGSIYDKTKRLEALVKILASESEREHLVKSAAHCKSDLASQIVGELPALQGSAGGYFAQKHNMHKEAEIISQHYLPQGAESQLPAAAAAPLALADKIDSLVGLFIAGHRATGSKDPFSLRRLALGIIRILLMEDAQINHSLKNIIRSAAGLYGRNDEGLEKEILLFIQERMHHYYKGKYDVHLVRAAVDLEKNHALSAVDQKLKFLHDFCMGSAGKSFLSAYKRISNIAATKLVEESFAQPDYTGEMEKKLYGYFKTIKTEQDYQKLLQADHSVIGNFLDNVLINDADDARGTKRRLKLLQDIKNIYLGIADFDSILPLLDQA